LAEAYRLIAPKPKKKAKKKAKELIIHMFLGTCKIEGIENALDWYRLYFHPRRFFAPGARIANVVLSENPPVIQ
jgi:hypothetical protein